jgi:anti-sigma28 factor (negative regulator of flagellin synthesis)
MPKLAVRSLPLSIVIALLLGELSPSAIAGQPPPNFGGILGAILNSAVRDQVRADWQNRPNADYSCLETHNLSADRLAADGVGPNDPRIQRIFAQCADQARQATVLPVVASHNHDFVVDGLAVGAAVYPDSPAYRAYRCKPSDEFPGFTWCANKHPMTGKLGPFDSWVNILHSDANIAVFISQDVLPAYFSPSDAEREIDRLSQHFGQRARVLTGDSRSDAPHSVIAAWGDVTLTPLDEPTMEALRRGETITAGLVIDFLADSRKSAREGLPVFRMGGGAGYIWAAEFDDFGKGRLRITAVNPSLLPASPVEPFPPIAYTPPPSPTPAPTTTDPAEIEKDRAARAERAVAAANQQLDDAAAVIKEHADSPNVFDYVDRINALKAAVKNGEPDDIERKSTDLTNILSHDKDYQQHLANLAEAQKKREARYLLDAIRRGQKERDFIHDYIVNNLLADATPTLAPLVKQLDPALQRADLDQLQPLVDKIDTAIREANLEPAFIATQTEKKADTTPGTPVPPPDKLPTTEKNRFLVEGDLDDVELLYNASPKAPSVARNLRGDFVFSENQARACLFGQNPDGLALIVKQAILLKVNPRLITITFEPCHPDNLLSYDILAAQRSAFLRSKRDDALALIKTVEDDNYRKFAEVTAAALNKVTDTERAQIEKIKANIADGAPDGFGVVLLKTGSANLCLAVGSKVRTHHQLLLGTQDELNLEMQTDVIIAETNIDDAFITVQKLQCGAVYASAADLKILTAALTRNDIPFAFEYLEFAGRC